MCFPKVGVRTPPMIEEIMVLGGQLSHGPTPRRPKDTEGNGDKYITRELRKTFSAQQLKKLLPFFFTSRHRNIEWSIFLTRQ